MVNNNFSKDKIVLQESKELIEHVFSLYNTQNVQIDQDRKVILELIDELDRIRLKWKESHEQYEDSNRKCEILKEMYEKSLKTIKSLEDENDRLNACLNATYTKRSVASAYANESQPIRLSFKGADHEHVQQPRLSRKNSTDTLDISNVDYTRSDLDPDSAKERQEQRNEQTADEHNEIQDQTIAETSLENAHELDVEIDEPCKAISVTANDFKVRADIVNVRRSNSLPDLLDGIPVSSQQMRASAIGRTSSLNVTPKQSVIIEELDGEEASDEDDASQSISNKAHNFIRRRNFTTMQCAFCTMNIGFSHMCHRCQVCKLNFHSSCLLKINLPCIKAKSLKRKLSNKNLRLGDFCPDQRPMIPKLIVFCSIYLEKSTTGLTLYKTLGNEKEAQKIVDTFRRSKNLPNFCEYGPMTVAGAIKIFLTELKTPLIPASYHEEFKCAAKIPTSSAELLNLIQTLPHAHCDTLTYLCKHFKRLTENKQEVQTLSESMGHVLFGNQSEDTSLVLSKLLENSINSFNSIIYPEKKIMRINSDKSQKPPKVTLRKKQM